MAVRAKELYADGINGLLFLMVGRNTATTGNSRTPPPAEMRCNEPRTKTNPHNRSIGSKRHFLIVRRLVTDPSGPYEEVGAPILSRVPEGGKASAVLSALTVGAAAGEGPRP